MARLEVLEGFHCGQSLTLPDEALLGRNPDSFLCLPDAHVSRQHARISRQGTTFVIEDLNSTRGVLVKGERLRPQVPYDLHDGDEINICSTRLVFRTISPVPASPASGSGDVPRLVAEDVSRDFRLEDADSILSLRMLSDEAPEPAVTMMLDASINLAQLSAREQPTEKGLQEALKRLQAMCQISTALGAITDRETVLNKIIDCIFEIFPAAERAFVMLREQDSDTLEPVVARARHRTPRQHEEVAVSRTIVDQVITHKRAILSSDALDDTRFNQQMSIVALSIRSMMCAPLLLGEEILGLIQVDTHTIQGGFTAADLQILTGMSTQAAVAVKNQQLYQDIEAETARRVSLQRYFSPGLVAMLMSGDVTTALGGSTYRGPVLFADIIGFTAMSEKMAPVQVVAKLNRYFSVMQKVVYAHGGNVDKFNGDSIMAFWGVPLPKPHDDSDAVLTAIRMQEQLWPFNMQLHAEGQQPIHMGIGLNSGEFVAGNIGSEDKIEFTVIGDTVNLAARAEKLAGSYQVLVSEDTWLPIRHLVCAVRFPPLEVKGKSQPVIFYSIRAVQDRFQEGYALALPCRILDAAGTAIGDGILTGSPEVSPRQRFLFSTTMSLTPGDSLTLQLGLREYHEPLRLTTTVDTCAPVEHDGFVTYNQAMLTATGGQAARAFLTPGSCLVARATWRSKRE
jgi:adenylate cyclase